MFQPAKIKMKVVGKIPKNQEYTLVTWQTKKIQPLLLQHTFNTTSDCPCGNLWTAKHILQECRLGQHRYDHDVKVNLKSYNPSLPLRNWESTSGWFVFFLLVSFRFLQTRTCQWCDDWWCSSLFLIGHILQLYFYASVEMHFVDVFEKK